MREIKFRAWSGEEMISPDYIDRNGIAWWKENSIPTSTDKVMQFTGLRDKNGREIYEGDIINAIISEFRIETMGEVIYSEYYSAFVNKNHAGETILLKLDDFEIIGNIHENPELLK